MIHDAAFWIRRLGLQHHPEGGYFRETYRADESLAAAALPRRFSGPRSLSTAIYFLLPGSEVSRWHRIKSDEVWHFYAGSAITVHVLDPAGGYTAVRLGPNPEHDECFQTAIKAGCCFGAAVDEPQSFALVGCTVAPGFDFADFELVERQQLTAIYPQHTDLIRRLTS